MLKEGIFREEQRKNRELGENTDKETAKQHKSLKFGELKLVVATKLL